MTECLLALGLLVGCTEAPAADAWLAEDKVRHFTVSVAATTMGYGAARFILGPEPAAITAASLALALGVAKEVHDVRGGGSFSFKDLAWDATGVTLGFILAKGVR